jgi:hypothetical protein
MVWKRVKKTKTKPKTADLFTIPDILAPLNRYSGYTLKLCDFYVGYLGFIGIKREEKKKRRLFSSSFPLVFLVVPGVQAFFFSHAAVFYVLRCLCSWCFESASSWFELPKKR